MGNYNFLLGGKKKEIIRSEVETKAPPPHFHSPSIDAARRPAVEMKGSFSTLGDHSPCRYHPYIAKSLMMLAYLKQYTVDAQSHSAVSILQPSVIPSSRVSFPCNIG